MQNELQQKYLEYQILEKSIKQLSVQLQQIEQQANDTQEVTQTISDLSEVQQGTTILYPLSTGLFFEGKIENAKNIYVNIGAGAIIKKTLQQTIKDLNDQVINMKAVQQEIHNKIEELTNRAFKIEEDLKKLAGEKDV